MNTDVTMFTVLRSRDGRHEIHEKNTSDYRLRIGDHWVVAHEGSRTMCEEYKTPGQKFKEKYGYSHTLSRLLGKHVRRTGSVIGVEDYKKIRKERKKLQQKETKDKHDRARAGRKAKEAKKKK